MVDECVLVIAFDGLDKELIDDYGCDNIKQQEYGNIDNNKNIAFIKTSELFASFITGYNYEEHGVVGLKKRIYSNNWKNVVVEKLAPKKKRKTKRGFYRLYSVLNKVLRTDITEIGYSRNDLDSKSLFDDIEGSRAMFVPSYNPDPLWATGSLLSPLSFGYGVSRVEKIIDRRCFEPRKAQLFSELENSIISPRPFLMCHFHKPDYIHHFYADEDSFGGEDLDEKKVRKMYNEMDQFAQEIKEKAEEAGYDTIIFMSDHGRPADLGHNENAFYSCNKELFGGETPHITDFHGKILDLTGN